MTETVPKKFWKRATNEFVYPAFTRLANDRLTVLQNGLKRWKCNESEATLPGEWSVTICIRAICSEHSQIFISFPQAGSRTLTTDRYIIRTEKTKQNYGKRKYKIQFRKINRVYGPQITITECAFAESSVLRCLISIPKKWIVTDKTWELN